MLVNWNILLCKATKNGSSKSFMKILIVIFLAIVLTGCASTQMKSYIDKPIQEADLELGKPVNIIELPNNRRAYQYYWGGGTVVIPGSAESTITGNTYSTNINTIYKPAMVVSSKGCLVTLIASRIKGVWIVKDWRIPQKLVC